MLSAHEGGVFSLCVTKDGHMLSGGKDRRIVQWDSNFKQTGLECKVKDDSSSHTQNAP